MSSIVRMDTRGRLVIPTEFRQRLNLEEGDEVLISLDSETDTLTISPTYGKPINLVRINIEFSDTPGCLARIAYKIAELKIDLIKTESKSSQRGKKARWDIIADISKTDMSFGQIRQKILQSGFVETVSIQRIARDRVHR